MAALVLLCAAVSDVLVLGSQHASPKAFLFPVTLALIAILLASELPVGRAGWVAVAAIASVSLALLMSGWGLPLNTNRTERAFAERHPNLPSPIRCRPGHQELGGLFEKVYVCLFRGSDSRGFPVAVNDKRIVDEWP